MYWIPFTQSCRRLGPSSPHTLQSLLIVIDMCISQVRAHNSYKRKPAGALSWGLLRQALSFPFVCISFRKRKTMQDWKVKTALWSLDSGMCTRFKTIWGDTGQHLASQRLRTMGESLWLSYHHFYRIWINVEKNCFCLKGENISPGDTGWIIRTSWRFL